MSDKIESIFDAMQKRGAPATQVFPVPIEAHEGEITFKADEQFVLIRDRGCVGACVVLTRDEAAFVRDQITAALAAGLVKP